MLDSTMANRYQKRAFLVSFLPLLLHCSNQRANTSTESGAETSGSTTTTSGTTDDPIVCKPGDVRCADSTTRVVCADTGREWIPAPCGPYQSCIDCAPDDPACTDGARCIGPCEVGQELPSSAGCSFLVTRPLQLEEADPDAVIIGNPDPSAVATVQLFTIATGSRTEEPAAPAFMLGPGEHTVIQLEEPHDDQFTSMFRTGGIHRIRSDLPIIAYLQSPIETRTTNDGSMLLPDTALRQDYVAMAWPPRVAMHPLVGNGEPTYFRVIAIEDGTTLTWTPRTATAGSELPIPFVSSGETGSIILNKYDTLRIAASMMEPSVENRDISGTAIHANKPIWVLSASYCAFVEENFSGDGMDTCDHLQEMPIPLDYWGTTYVGPASPPRGSEKHFWRIFSGADNVSVTVTPSQPGTPILLEKRGDYVDLVVDHGTHLVFNGDGPFMPVQYLSAHDNANGIGDPSMYQMIPVEQYLNRYVFVTGVNYKYNYVQIIRKTGNADVELDGNPVSGYESVGEFEVATVQISEGAHNATSTQPFGIIQVGYSDGAMSNWSSYAFPGGMKVEQIFVP